LPVFFIYATPDMKCTSPYISIDCVAEIRDKTANVLSAWRIKIRSKVKGKGKLIIKQSYNKINYMHW
jgi:hypothetical protein